MYATKTRLGTILPSNEYENAILWVMLIAMKYDKSNSGLISSIVRIRSEFIELLVLAVMLAFGVNLVSTYLSSTLSVTNSGIWGVLILLAAVLYILYRRFFTKPQVLVSKAVISTMPKKNELLKINEYKFNNAFIQVLESLFIENEAYKNQWEKGLLDIHDGKKMRTYEELNESDIYKLVKEITEYIYLDILSTHLADYFNEDGFDSRCIQKLLRSDLSAVVLSNRALDLISKDLKDRPAFADRVSGKDDDTGGDLVMSWHNGVLYSKFDLVLPKGSRVIRETDSSITIKNRNINLNFHVVLNGLNAFVDPTFVKYYMNISKAGAYLEAKHYAVEVITKISVRPTFALFSKRIHYQQWAESFIRKLDHKMSFKTFLEDINWRTVKTFLQAGREDGKTDRPRNDSGKVTVEIFHTD